MGGAPDFPCAENPGRGGGGNLWPAALYTGMPPVTSVIVSTNTAVTVSFDQTTRRG